MLIQTRTSLKKSDVSWPIGGFRVGETVVLKGGVAEKAGLSKDESADLQDEIQKALKKFEGEIESLVTQRDKEIMTL